MSLTKDCFHIFLVTTHPDHTLLTAILLNHILLHMDTHLQVILLLVDTHLQVIPLLVDTHLQVIPLLVDTHLLAILIKVAILIQVTHRLVIQAHQHHIIQGMDLVVWGHC